MDAVPNVTLSLSVIAMVAGAIFSLAFNFIPKLNVWFALKPARYKQGFMALCGLFGALGALGLSCINIINTGVPCTVPGVTNVVFMWVAWVAGNQSADRGLEKPKAVRRAKEAAKAKAGTNNDIG